ncbi:HAMP domain-containing histidine kinase [Ruminococcaceae bacterium OttesenSCG-928-I18]|nr:HAMP domain-containing histidine kinase [Ruminococcaceae bacterium OttesenSCG-928-I18]
MNSITKRWMRGSLLFTLAILLIAEGVFLYYMISGYYNYANAAIRDQFNTIRSQLTLFSSSSSEEKNLRLIRAVEQFEEKTRFELMLIDSSGQIVLTSSGVLPAVEEPAEDIQDALRAGATEPGRYVGKNENGEKVMAMTELTPYSSGNIVAMRLVTSLTQVDGSIVNLVVASLLFVGLILLASVISGVYFIRSIVIPLQKVETTASSIAEGDFDTRIDYKTNDEIGSLCSTINNMAEELGHTERMKNEFITSVSHELRTPLTSIKGWTETVGRFKGPDDPGFRRSMEIISGETDRLYNMVEELLDFSKMQNGLELKMEWTDLAAEVEETSLLTAQRAENLGIILEAEIPEWPVPIMADPHRVRQVLLNILDNAIKYSKYDDTIKLEILQNDDYAYVVVTDEGRGISEEDLKNVKLKFYKGEGAMRGSGIGLAVADEIMRGHDGELSIESTLGEGTKVTLRFPLHPRKDGPAKQPKREEKNTHLE